LPTLTLHKHKLSSGARVLADSLVTEPQEEKRPKGGAKILSFFGIRVSSKEVN
jgi:hypothetical protein